MAPRVFGLETEYAVTDLGAVVRRDDFLRRLMDTACRRLPHLLGHRDNGMFLTNAGRFYIDVGGHPEFATPEVQDPWDAVRYVRAGDRIMLDLTAAMKADNSLLQPLVMRGNVDYSGRGTTWGCHESYLHTSDLEPEALAAQVIPHLVSRIVFAGAGGFNPLSPGIQFTLSPRAWHLEHAISGDSTGSRGIFHTRDQPLCGPGYRRMHLLCGDSLRSETSLWLLVATTALVVALTEAGLAPGDAVRLPRPVHALRAFAADPGLRKRVAVAGGRRATALSIQRHYLEQAERHAGAAFMPKWAAEACGSWRTTLDRLQRAPHLSARSLDWQIKLAAYREQVRQSPLDAAQVAHWNAVLTSQVRSARATPEASEPGPVGGDRRRMGLAERLRAARGMQAPPPPAATLLSEQGVAARDAQPFLDLRARLLALETRYGALGPESLFEGLDRSGVLEHRMVTDEEIGAATHRPPAVGRARLRGEAVRLLAVHGRGSCSWIDVFDGVRDLVLDLHDPFETREEWRSHDAAARSAARPAAVRDPRARYRIFSDPEGP